MPEAFGENGLPKVHRFEWRTQDHYETKIDYQVGARWADAERKMAFQSGGTDRAEARIRNGLRGGKSET